MSSLVAVYSALKFRETDLTHEVITRMAVQRQLVEPAVCFSTDGWMTCDFTSFLTVFQSYQDDFWMIMKGCVQWNSVNG